MSVVLCFTATIHKGKEAEFERLIAELVPIMRAGEPEMIDFLWGKSEEASTYTLVETFNTYQSLEFHRSSSHEAEYGPRIGPLIQSAHKSIFVPIGEPSSQRDHPAGGEG